MNKLKNFYEYLKKTGVKYPNKIAIIDEVSSINYSKLISNIEKISFAISKKKKIIIFTKNDIETITMINVFSNINANFIPINHDFFKSDLSRLLEIYKPDLIVAHTPLLKFLKHNKHFSNLLNNKKKVFSIGEKIGEEYNYKEIIKKGAFVKKIYNKHKKTNFFLTSFTSGTTGKPKKIYFTEKNFIDRAFASNQFYKIKKKNFLISTPLYHTLAIKSLFMAITAESSITLIDKFTSYKWLKISKNVLPSIWLTSSSQIKELIQNYENDFFNLINVKKIISAADSLDIQYKQKILKKAKFEFYDTYGTTETDGISNLKVNKSTKNLQTVGKINNRFKVKILRNKILYNKNNITGEICCKSPFIFDNIISTESKKKLFKDGFYKTGDYGYFDSQKNLNITGRKKNIIIVSGINIYPEKIEKIIKQIPNIKDACVIGKKNLISGEEIIAFIQSEKKINTKKIMNFLVKNLPSFSIPRKFIFIQQIPKNKMKKNDREKLYKFI